MYVQGDNQTTVRFGQILSAIELLGMGNFNEYLLLLLLELFETAIEEIEEKIIERDGGGGRRGFL